MTRSIRPRLALTAAWAALWLCACDIGAPLVDSAKQPPTVGPLPCAQAPNCDPEPPPASPDHAATSVKLGECGVDPCEAPSGSSDAPGADAPFCPGTDANALPDRADCSTLALRAPPDTTELIVQDASWSNFNLAIASETETELVVTLMAPRLDGVFVRLSGAVVLRILDASQLHDLRFHGSASEHGRPRVELERVQAELVSVGEPKRAFDGTIAMHATTLEDLDLRADALTLESVRMKSATLRARELQLTDVDLELVQLESDTVQLSVFSARDTRLLACGDVSLIDGTMSKSTLEICPERPARLYSVAFSAGALDGAFELDHSTISQTRIGATSATQIVAFESGLDAAMFCPNAERFAFGNMSTIKCSNCEDGLGAPDSVCTLLPQIPPEANSCPALANEPPLPECGEDVPRRTRPRS